MKNNQEEAEDLELQISNEKDPEKKQWMQFALDMISGKKGKNERVLREVQEIDKHLRTSMALVLNFYAENQGQFNQKLLEDVAQLIIKRSKLVKKLRG